MGTAELVGLRDLQEQFPNSRVTIDRHGVAVINPIDRDLEPQLPGIEQALQEVRVGIGQTTLLKLHIEG